MNTVKKHSDKAQRLLMSALHGPDMRGTPNPMRMPVKSAVRYRGVIALVGAIALFVSGAATQAAEVKNTFVNGQTGFVVSHIAYALSRDGSETGACPNGMAQSYKDIFSLSADGQRREGESDKDYGARVTAGFRALGTASNGQNLCPNPEAGAPDPHFRWVTGKNVPAEGIDLDGQDSHMKGKPAPGTCAHDDFRGMNGERGIDNQFFRAVGCAKGFQSTGQANTFEVELYTGSWGILITLKGATDLRNSKDVEVGIYASADPIQLSPTREALPNATYAVDQDPRFLATTHGRIVNGVLTTDPVDVRFHWIVNSIYLERALQDARLHATITPDGGLDGYLAGYTDIENLYDFQFGFRNGTDSHGKPPRTGLIQVSSNGAALSQGYTCNGMYYALKQLADGHRDPATGQCRSISTQYRIKAVPAFVVNATTHSINEALVKQ